MNNSPLGVCAFSEPADNLARVCSYPSYVFEILDHAGICYRALTPEELAGALPLLRILLTVGEGAPSPELRTALHKWIEQGGGWISIAGLLGMEDLLGVVAQPAAFVNWGGGPTSLGEGYLQPVGSHPVTEAVSSPRKLLHFTNGVAVCAAGASVLAETRDAHGRPPESGSARVGVAENLCGAGRAVLIAPDITGTVVRVQQGLAVTRDGLNAPDGSAPIADGVLKSDDGCVLDWHFDRDAVPGLPGFAAFLHPVADQWREVLLRSIFHVAHQLAVRLPVLWLYPRGLPSIGHLSHDSDLNDPEKAESLLSALHDLDVTSTWCVILPGYEAALIERISGAGHELAAHYDAMTEGLEWGEGEFTRQLSALQQLFGADAPVSNKNHYLRWEGDTEFFRWCEGAGIQLDQSKGASKTGEAGFNFGTCHAYFPLDPHGTPHNVLELPTPTQDLGLFAPVELLAPLLEAAIRHHGVLHLLFHPAHVDKPGIREALAHAVGQGRKAGLEWWTARRLNAWERARRTVHWSEYRCDGREASVTLTAQQPLPEAVILWSEPGGDASVERWRFPFRAVQVNIEAAMPVTISSEGTSS